MLRVDVAHGKGTFQLHASFETLEPVTGIIGPSGAGKSTLLAVIAGLERPQSGRIELDGSVLFDSANRIFVPTHRRRIAVVFQDHRLFPHLSVRSNLLYGERLLPPAERRVSFDTVVELLALGGLLDRSVRGLSGGEAQRVAIGRALLASPRLLLLDEPLASLHRELKEQILPFLRQIKTALGIPMLYVSHELAETLQLTRSLVVLETGNVVGAGKWMDLVGEKASLRSLHALGIWNVFELEAAGSDQVEGLTHWWVAEGRPLSGPVTEVPRGGRLWAALRPEDIALSLGPVARISIQNQLQGRVARITTRQGRALLEVDVGVPLLAEVSLKTLTDLALAVGSSVVCLFKANAIRYL